MYGHNVSHAKNRTRKIFKPNLHTARITIGGASKKLRLCTKCLRMLKKATSKVDSKSVKIPEAIAEQAAV